MTFISASSAYIRKKEAPLEMPEPIRHTHAADIWRLLATPQTVATLRRHLENEAVAEPEESSIEAVLKELLRRDLIEMSPDA